MSFLLAPARAAVVVALLVSGCSRSPAPAASSAAVAAQSDDPRYLAAWRGYKSEAIPTGWAEQDGVITKTGNAADLVSRKQYGDFELTLDWKLSSGGNAGIFYRATEEYDRIYWSGPEYQLLDNAQHPDGRNPLTRAASAYGFYSAPATVVHPAGEWNATRIVARGNHIEHWLNGQKVVEYELGSADWRAKLAKNKFAAWPNFGKAPRGHIGLQGDHTGLLSFRNITIKELK